MYWKDSAVKTFLSQPLLQGALSGGNCHPKIDESLVQPMNHFKVVI